MKKGNQNTPQTQSQIAKYAQVGSEFWKKLSLAEQANYKKKDGEHVKAARDVNNPSKQERYLKAALANIHSSVPT